MKMNPDDLFGGIALVVVGLIVVLAFAVQALICYLVADAQKTVPPEHRKMEPGLVWLLMIPCFNIIWNFFVFIQVPASFESFFKSRQEKHDDSLGVLGIIYAVLSALTVIPYLGACLGLAGLVLLIILLVKLNDTKKRVVALTTQPDSPFGFGRPM